MPFLDHFRPPVDPRHRWDGFDSPWGAALTGLLNQRLPERFLASMHVRLGPSVEADVAEFDGDPEQPRRETNGASGGVALAIAPYAPPAVTPSVPADFPDDIEVQVTDTRDDLALVGVIELSQRACRAGAGPERSVGILAHVA